jgi:uncharacterized membrane protein YoaK (UPF0700 family)
VVVLTFGTGVVDAASFLHLGGAFSSVITGNMVLLGVAAGSRNAALALHGGLALAGYAAGVAIGAPLAGPHPQQDQSVWPARVTICLAAEAVVLIGFSAGWLAAGGHPGTSGKLALLATGAVAMGMQSAAVRRLGQMSSTYLTSTLTGIVAGLATRQRPAGFGRSLGSLAAIVAGAAASIAVAAAAPDLLPVLVLLPPAAVLASGPRLHHEPAGDRR